MKVIPKLVALSVALPLLSGCWLVDKLTGKTSTPGTAVEGTDFDSVMTQLHTLYVDELVNRIPEVDIPVKAEQKFALNANVQPGFPGFENVVLNMTSEGKSDFSDEKNPAAESTVKLSGELTGTESGKGNLELGFKTLENEMYLSLVNISAETGGQALPVSLIVGPYLGKWYGGTFAEIDAAVSEASGGTVSGIHLENSIRSPQKIMQDIRTNLGSVLSQVHIWKLEETLPEENDMLRYRVSLDVPAFQNSLIALTQFAVSPDGNLDANSPQMMQIKDDIVAEITRMQPELAGELGVNKNDVRLMSFTGTATANDTDGTRNSIDFAFNRSTENNFSLSAQEKKEGGETLELSQIDGHYTLMTNGKKLLEGTHTDDEWAGTMYQEDGTNFGSFAFTRKGEHSWSGTVSITSLAIEITVNDLTWSPRSVTVNASGTMNGNPLFTTTLTYTVTEVNAVNITRPETVTPIKDLLGAFGLGAMGTLPPESMMDDHMMMSGDTFPEGFDPSMFEELPTK